MIAHRLSTLSKCDKIYEIKKGEAHIKEKINVV
jgi:ABC-type multidrug transport system fused ATPase/permease subunit